ncbi:alpha/beta hydrolase-fold protein [Arthrobacter sp. SLBN-53]|uniref:alpha/beta hydrolase n=1 Tax=Arthrobacter sp. SLBN-53 TaxID=2768412 RepID=UPI00114EEBD9|nr:alpha/beta hydrolase-fold protein [Arthrobacter sp. SLBN-53]TQK30907.1 S-formylglutathione hydrolase FrmB [Arthrobacter sp. SLBN-53]
MLEWSLLSGPAPVALSVMAIAAGMWLVAQVYRAAQSPRVIVKTSVVCVATAVAVPLIGVYLVRDVWAIFPDRLPVSVYVWLGAIVLAVSLAVAVMILRVSPGRSAITVLTAVVVVAACLNQINMVFAAYPTVRDAFGITRVDDIMLPDRHQKSLPVSAHGPLDKMWASPAGLSRRGKITSAVIPATVSGFAARPARIYLPPAYFTDVPPRLPVLVLMAGQPGGPQDWISAGKLPQIMDAFAGSHDGLAPVVVVPDATGSQLADPLCLDSRRGNSATYLAIDVPAWIKARLTVDVRPTAWAVAGASYGGTCALQLATNHPTVYPTFIDIAGAAEPSLGDRARTVMEAFGGDERRFEQVNPADILRKSRFSGCAGAIVIGSSDRDNRPDAVKVLEATRAAGMDSHLTEVPGAHDWRAFSAGLSVELPWLARRIGLTG